jgi:hypothetical protein
LTQVQSDEHSDLYRLIEDESQVVVLTAADVGGFFADGSEAGEPVRLFGASRVNEALRRYGDIELQVLNRGGGVIGAYYIGDVRVIESQPSVMSGRSDVDLSFEGYYVPFKHAGPLWRKWASAPPASVGEWKGLPVSWRPSWLHVVQKAWFQAGRSAVPERWAPQYLLEGSDIVDLSSFYCALGEAVNGPGGYLGSGLDALEDCLRLKNADDCESVLIWNDAATATGGLSSSDFVGISMVLAEHGIQVVMRPQRGGRTL